MMNIHGLTGMVNFLAFLTDRKIPYSIRYAGSESLIVQFNILTKRIEIDFFEDHVQYSVFSGSEDVENDEGALFDLIKNHWD